MPGQYEGRYTNPRAHLGLLLFAILMFLIYMAVSAHWLGDSGWLVTHPGFFLGLGAASFAGSFV